MTGSPTAPRSRARLFAHIVASGLALVGLAGCATGRSEVDGFDLEPVVGWRVGTSEYIALWYHGLAYVREAPPADSVVLPRFDSGYVERITEIKRREGRYPTPLDERAAEFAAIFKTSDAFEGLEFLPLYFRDAEAFYSGIDLWNRAGGNPYNAPVVEAVRLIAFLSQLFPRPAERQAVVEWVALIRQEDDAFYSAHWSAVSTPLAARAGEVQAEWDALEPEIREYLNYIGYRNGEIFLVPALGPEGRTVTGEARTARIAVLAPPPGRPEDALWSIVHELLYPLVDDVIREHVAPARIRELGEQRLASAAAVRGGAILLEQTVPARADEYRRFFLSAVGEATRLTGDELDRAFRDAFPIPSDLVTGLERGIEIALAGI